MKGIFRVFSIVILLAALVGGIILVKKNQETRRGAASTDASSSILPNTIATSPGASVSAFVWLNTGKDTDSLQGAEVLVSFDASKLNLTGFEPQNGYSVLDENLPFDTINKDGKLKFAMVALGAEKAGAVQVAKLTFKSVGSGSAGVVVAQAKIMVNGQSATWDIAKNNSSNVTISGSSPTVAVATVAPRVQATVAPTSSTFTCGWCGLSCTKMTSNMGACVQIAPPEGKNCVLQGTSCVIVAAPTRMPTAVAGGACGGASGIKCPTGHTCVNDIITTTPQAGVMYSQPYTTGKCVRDTTVSGTITRAPSRVPTVTAGGSCGQRCTKDTGCASGMVCTPIWWPCQSISTDLNSKLQANVTLDRSTVAGMTAGCPSVANILPTGYVASTSVRAPTFYGVCRNIKCVNSANCSCSTVSTTPRPITPTIRVVTPTIRNVTPTRATTTAVPNGKAALSLAFNNTSAKLGDEVTLQLSADVGGNNKISAVNTKINYFENFEVVSVQYEGRGNVIKENIDKVNGSITIYYTWSLPSDRLFNRYTVATIKMKAKSAGTKIAIFDEGYKHEVSGLNVANQSVGFDIEKRGSDNIVISEQRVCSTCSAGLPKTSGNSNCDGQINSVDFEIWRAEMFDQGGLAGNVSATWKSDFSCDQKVSGADFEIWRQTVFQ